MFVESGCPKLRAHNGESVWFCHSCIRYIIKKQPSVFPQKVVGFRRYNQAKLNEMLADLKYKVGGERSSSGRPSSSIKEGDFKLGDSPTPTSSA